MEYGPVWTMVPRGVHPCRVHRIAMLGRGSHETLRIHPNGIFALCRLVQRLAAAPGPAARKTGRFFVEGSLRIRKLDQRLAALAAYVAEGPFETTWDLFRFSYFKGRDEKEAVMALAAWALQQRVLVTFEIRKVRDTDVVHLLLKSSAS
jgi:hypothetical protein